MSELAEAVHQSRSRLTHTITRMERSGLVERTTCPTDRRGVWAELTTEGFALLETAAPSHVEAVRRNFVEAMGPGRLRRPRPRLRRRAGRRRRLTYDPAGRIVDRAQLTAVDPALELVAELKAELRRRRARPTLLDTSDLSRALYSSDASLYRVVPQAVARPRTVDEAVLVLDAARAAGVPVTTRGAGTSCAGQRGRTGADHGPVPAPHRHR